MRSICLKGAEMGVQACADIVEALVHSAADSLEELNLSGESVTDAMVQRLTECTNLRRLTLADCVQAASVDTQEALAE